MAQCRWYLSTIDPRASEMAARLGFGLEITEFCTAWNVDYRFSEVDAALRGALNGISSVIYHGPFNELHPCAIDPKARELAAFRFREAITLAREYGAKKVVFHGGYIPRVYHPQWYQEQSILFWKAFLETAPEDVTICLENVLEDSPQTLAEIVRQVDDDRLGLCLDIGHMNVYSDLPAEQWIACWGRKLYHAHIHNNDGTWDTHSSLDAGSMDVAGILRQLMEVNPQITLTLELPNAADAPGWLVEKEFLR